ncbi:hypothetical protein BDV26DRAFT_256587 [Aspergillus bertholletiae]|uniref:Uncharacterized protein n=1 Tax=Aspergillus bertholletiae TaxID=1226010 RepID=A0A5N7BGM6_9EURO|nr:hypothetical protein BDV26DRAFT_256587 [Aspergillus bertholletiae]
MGLLLGYFKFEVKTLAMLLLVGWFLLAHFLRVQSRKWVVEFVVGFEKLLGDCRTRRDDCTYRYGDTKYEQPKRSVLQNSICCFSLFVLSSYQQSGKA